MTPFTREHGLVAKGQKNFEKIWAESTLKCKPFDVKKTKIHRALFRKNGAEVSAMNGDIEAPDRDSGMEFSPKIFFLGPLSPPRVKTCLKPCVLVH
jgi:hypothetical protein